jgi:SAM-dependent methyltransferase
MVAQFDASRFIEWDVRNWSSVLTFWAKHSTVDISTCNALEIGARNGGLSFWLASQGARVTATDITERPSDVLNDSKGDLNIHYQRMDATSIPYRSEFDVVLFKSVLGGIGIAGGKDLQQQAVTEMHKALRPGGELFFAENLVASPLHHYCRQKFVAWGASWRYVSISEMKQFLAGFSKVQYTTVGFLGAFGRNERQRQLLGVADQVMFNRTVPESWKYIIVGIAKK